MKFTIPGGTGFIGSRLVRELRRQGHDCDVPARGAVPASGADLGHVVYCIGLTADFRTRWRDTIRAHVEVLADYLANADFRSFLYLSSTRVYSGSSRGDEEAALRAAPLDPSDLYNLSKLTGESLCFSSGRSSVRVARLANVYGPDFDSENFLMSLVRSAVDDRRIQLKTTPDAAKDYVSLDDVVDLLPRIALSGRERLYNVASGRTISSGAIVERLRSITGCSVEVEAAGSALKFPALSIARVQKEFAFQPRELLEDLPGLVDQYRRR